MRPLVSLSDFTTNSIDFPLHFFIHLFSETTFNNLERKRISLLISCNDADIQAKDD